MSKKEQQIYKKIKRKLSKDGESFKNDLRSKMANTAKEVDSIIDASGERSINDYVSAGIPSDLPPSPALNTIQEKLDAGEPITYSENGVFHTAIPLQTIKYKQKPNELVTQNEGSFIVLGTDDAGKGTESGYGARGSNRANSIDLVVGRMSSAREGKGPPDSDKESGTFVDSSNFADAARIHISQLTDIDKNFGLAQTNTDQSVGRSGIAVKADAVRIIGREGIKIVTGRADGPGGFGQRGEPNSLGGKIGQPAPTIDLIAGNNTGNIKVWGGLFQPVESIPNLQPAVKGYITRDAFRDLGNIIDEIWSALYTLTLVQIRYNGILGSDPFRPWVPPAAVDAVASQILFVMNSLYHTRVNKNMWEFNYLYPFGYKFICSRNVNIT
jgi:hypothetical protein|tara:strand:- start:74 stop:1225 length:1152 start_codon:yes stop_codon:yes gene_type:complete